MNWPVPIFPHTRSEADPDLGTILAERIDRLGRGVGIAAGVVDSNGRRITCHGTLAIADPRAVEAKTMFEIGSATKIFTSALLLDMAQRGEVALDDPVGRYLPSGVRVPHGSGKEITLRNLATHTSGLPNVPSNVAPADINNPYVEYTVDQFWNFLSRYELDHEPGSQYEYSNLGYGLLGQALTRRAGLDYETLLRERITGPLKMASTAITLSPEMKSRMATGYGPTRRPARYWEIQTLAAAGALRSDVEDMLTFLSAPLAARALGWKAVHRGDKDLLWHNGATGGFRSFIGCDPRARVAVVVLSNMATPEGVDDIGMHLLDPEMPVAELNPLILPPEIPIPPEIFDRYTGVYRFPSGVELTITREGPRFFAQLSGQDRFEIFAESERQFLYRVVDVRLTFGEGEVVVRQRRETSCAYLSRHSGEQK